MIELFTLDKPPNLGDAEILIDCRAIDLGRGHVDLDRQVRAGIVALVPDLRAKACIGHSDFIGVEIVRQIGLESTYLGLPRRFTTSH